MLEKAVGQTSPTRKRGDSSTDDPRLRVGLVDWDDTAHEMAVTPRGLAKSAEKNAATLLMSVSCRRQLIDLSDDMATKIDVQYYSDRLDALLKSIQD